MGRLRTPIQEVSSGSIERKIVTGAIVSTKFCQKMFRLYEPGYIQAVYARKVMGWVRDYFHKYDEAPGDQIETIFQAHRDSLKDADRELIEQFLLSISEEYERAEVFNHQYLLDQTIRYFRKRSLENLFGKGQALLLKDKVDEVESQVQSYNKISQEMNQAVDPFSVPVIRDTLAAGEDAGMFAFPGALGALVGPFERDWLVGFMGPMKRGKCVAEGTNVLLYDGSYLPIEKLCNYKGFVLSLGRDGKIEKKRMMHFYDNGKAKVFLVKTRTGREIELTSEHPILSVFGWKKLKDVQTGDYIAVLKKSDLGDRKLYMKSDVLWDKIVGIEPVGTKKVYDLSIEDSHNFVANDIIVHNSWWLQEVAIQAITNKYKCLFISLEMNTSTVIRRFYKRVLAMADEPGTYVYPEFDCLRNQLGECKRKDRTGTVALAESRELLPTSYKPVDGYQTCRYCRDNGRVGFKPAIWYSEIKQKKRKIKELEKHLSGFSNMFGKNLKVVCFPAFTARVNDIIAELDSLEYEGNFTPDVVVVDYADILAIESREVSERGNIDITWKKLKGMAGQRHILVVTASQSNRGSIKKRSVEQTDTAEDIRKIAHVDIMISLNQQPEERERGLMRLGVIAHRHKEIVRRQVLVLQQLELGQPFLDSEWDLGEKR